MTLGVPILLVLATGFKKLVMKLLSLSTVGSAEPANKLESCSGIPPQVRASLILALVISLFSIWVLPPCKGIPSCPTLLTLLLSRALAKEKPVIESPTMLAALTALCEQTRHNSSYLNRLKKQTTMIKPIESIFISNNINSHSDGFI